MDKDWYIATTNTRTEYISFFDEMVRAIDPYFFTEATLPFLIELAGRIRSGKSLVWDTCKDRLLEAGGKLMDDYQTEDGSRIYERWSGQMQASGEPISLVFYNAKVKHIPAGKTMTVEQLIRSHMKSTVCPRDFGDILFVNYGYFRQHTALKIIVDFNCSAESPADTWKREISLAPVSRTLRNSPPFDSFIRTRCI